MTHRVCVFGLWHLGCVTAASLASLGFEVVGLDTDVERVAALQDGRPPVAEPGLSELIGVQLDSRQLTFTTDPVHALRNSEFLWVTFDTPVDEDDQADPGWVRTQLEGVRHAIRPATVVMVSSQVPVGFTTSLEREWQRLEPTLKFAYIPENLRLGSALNAFLKAERFVVGLGTNVDRQTVAPLFEALRVPVEYMSIPSAEMTKHALNCFLAVSVAYTNELARICERVGADAAEVERGLRTDPRVGPRAYVSAGAAFAGGTLARDISFLSATARQHEVASPLIDAVRTSNEVHKEWVHEQLQRQLAGLATPHVALLGLTYKPGTDTLRRSSSLELGAWLSARGAQVRGFDPAIRALPHNANTVQLVATVEAALDRADVAVLATPWPEFRQLTADQVTGNMRRPVVIDEAGFLKHLADDPRIRYVRVGRA